MKKIVLVAAFFLFPLNLIAQQADLSGDKAKEWDSMIQAVSTENWDTAFTAASRLLERTKTEDKEKRLAKTRYIYLFSAAGRVANKTMSYDELAAAVKPFIGKEIAIPFREVTDNCPGALNFICATGSDKRSLLVAATNKTGTTILSFEYLKFKSDPQLSKYVGKMLAFLGTVTAIEPNSNRSNLIILRIYADNVSIFSVWDKSEELISSR